ncbi:BTB/POZ domain-containing protein 9 isoform X2 [Drosophila mauritiana]|uniref:BTB/POZ domain-containing protein 9 isoform X2 n=1 Tax=Drosophila mauritiana TaxID=7226 RepID=A0A6P8KHE0_DROMA|nr:BTB/POZ domain-containing protein 9 isoform X2 [Drosophila mauritiana]
MSLPQLIEDLQRLSEDQDSADVVFICGRDERIYAHRLMLMARCKSFKTAKRGEVCRIPGCTVSPAAPGASTPTTIRLPHVNPELFRQFILYVYTAKLVLQDSQVFQMMILAQDIGVVELRTACEDHVISTLSVDNACTFLTAVMDIHEKAGAKCAASFMERCIIYIGENANECVKTNAFLTLTKDAIIKIISSDYFCLEEEEVWRCVLSWAKYQAGVTQPTAHWTEEERARVCQHLSGVMGHVRLLLIDSQVFAEEVEPTGAVPMELSLERYRYAALHANKMMDNDKRLQPRLAVAVNMFPGSQILKNDNLPLQTVLNNWVGVAKQSMIVLKFQGFIALLFISNIYHYLQIFI